MGRFDDTKATSLLLLKGNRRSADPRCMEVDSYFNAVGNLNKGNAAVHSILLAVEGHGSLDRARAGNGQRELLGFLRSSNGEVPVHVESVRAGLDEFSGMKCDVRIQWHPTCCVT